MKTYPAYEADEIKSFNTRYDPDKSFGGLMKANNIIIKRRHHSEQSSTRRGVALAVLAYDGYGRNPDSVGVGTARHDAWTRFITAAHDVVRQENRAKKSEPEGCDGKEVEIEGRKYKLSLI